MKKGVDPLKAPMFWGLCQDFQEKVKSKVGKWNSFHLTPSGHNTGFKI